MHSRPVTASHYGPRVSPDVWLQPLATVVGAVIVGVAAYLTLRQRRSADSALLANERAALEHQRAVARRQQWWVRAQWAIDRSLSPDPVTRQVGTAALVVLADEDADPADLALLLVAAEEGVDSGGPAAHTGGPDAAGGDDRDGPRQP